MRTSIRILISIVLLCAGAAAQTPWWFGASNSAVSHPGFYLDAITGGGSDSNSGLWGHPWATLAHADATLSTNNTTLHVRYPNCLYYSAPTVWHNGLSYWPHVYGSSSCGLSATTDYDVWNSHNGAFGGSGHDGSNLPIYKYAGIVIDDGNFVTVTNFSNIWTSGAGAGISIQTNRFDNSTLLYTGSAFSITDGSSFFWLGNPFSSGPSVFFDFGASVNYSQDPIALANQQHAWMGRCGGGTQNLYLDTTSKGTPGTTCSFSLSNKPLLMGFLTGFSGMSGVLQGTMMFNSLSVADYLTDNTWFTGTEIPRVQHAPTPTTPGRISKPVMEWNNYDVYNGAATCQNVKDNALAMTTDGLQAVGYNQVNVPVGWSLIRTGGTLVENAAQCPLGVADLFTYVHGLGMTARHYLSLGATPCASMPTSVGHETTDANQAASFGADSVVYDQCGGIGGAAQADYQAMSTALLATGRPMNFFVSDGSYADNSSYWCPIVGGGELQTGAGNAPPITWTGVLSDAASTATLNTFPWAVQAPLCIPWINGLGVGNGTLTDQEGQADFAIYTTFGADLVLGMNTTTPPSATTFRTVENVEAIAVDQDTAGFGALRQQFACGGSNLCQLYTKQMSGSTGNAQWIVTIVNGASSSQSVTFHWDTATPLSDIAGSYFDRDLWNLWPASCTVSGGGFTCAANLTGAAISGATGISVTIPSHGAAQYALCSSQCTAL